MTLRVGIVGCGVIASGYHLPAWMAHDSAEVVGAADPVWSSLERMQVLAGLEAEQIHSDPMALVGRSDVDVIDVCTPPSIRRELLVGAAESGKHILCEKPLATVPSDAAAAVDAAERNGTKLAMVHTYGLLPEIKAAMRVLARGEIGTVRTVIVNYLGIPNDLVGSADYAPRWRYDAAQAGGGVLMNIIHGVYLAESLLGQEFQRASGYADNIDPESNVEDVALCRFEAADGAALVNIGTGLGNGGFEIAGTEGRISIRYENGGTAPWAKFEEVLVTTAKGTRVELSEPEIGIDPMKVQKDVFVEVVDDFVSAVTTKSRPRATGADGLRVLEATVGALESAAIGTTVKLPLERNGPAFEQGVLGLAELDLPDWSAVRRRGLYLPRTA
jgi:predicted dehydrogenase